jgi:hypothetical protein
VSFGFPLNTTYQQGHPRVVRHAVSLVGQRRSLFLSLPPRKRKRFFPRRAYKFTLLVGFQRVVGRRAKTISLGYLEFARSPNPERPKTDKGGKGGMARARGKNRLLGVREMQVHNIDLVNSPAAHRTRPKAVKARRGLNDVRHRRATMSQHQDALVNDN